MIIVNRNQVIGLLHSMAQSQRNTMKVYRIGSYQYELSREWLILTAELKGNLVNNRFQL